MDDLRLPLTLAGIIVASIILGLVAAAETALERASEVRIQALAMRGNPKARRIASKVQEPKVFLGPLTSARVLAAAFIVAMAAYLGAEAYGPLRGALGIGALSGAYVAVVQMTVGLVAARQPEYAALQLSEIVRFVGLFFAIPAFVLGLPSRMVARSIQAVTRLIAGISSRAARTPWSAVFSWNFADATLVSLAS